MSQNNIPGMDAKCVKKKKGYKSLEKSFLPLGADNGLNRYIDYTAYMSHIQDAALSFAFEQDKLSHRSDVFA